MFYQWDMIFFYDKQSDCCDVAYVGWFFFCLPMNHRLSQEGSILTFDTTTVHCIVVCFYSLLTIIHTTVYTAQYGENPNHEFHKFESWSFIKHQKRQSHGKLILYCRVNSKRLNLLWYIYSLGLFKGWWFFALLISVSIHKMWKINIRFLHAE